MTMVTMMISTLAMIALMQVAVLLAIHNDNDDHYTNTDSVHENHQ